MAKATRQKQELAPRRQSKASRRGSKDGSESTTPKPLVSEHGLGVTEALSAHSTVHVGVLWHLAFLWQGLCPFQAQVSHLYNSEQAFSLGGFTVSPWPKRQQNKNENPKRYTKLQPGTVPSPRGCASTTCQAPLLQPSPSLEPVTSAAAAQAETPWCQRSQDRLPLPSRWLPAALLLTPSSLRMPGSSLSAGKAHKSSVIYGTDLGSNHSRKRQTGPANTTMPG